MADQFLTNRVWQYIRDAGGVGREDIASTFGMQLHYVSTMCCRMHRQGSLTREYAGGRVTFRTTEVEPYRSYSLPQPKRRKSLRFKTEGLSWEQKAWRFIKDAGRPVRGWEVEEALRIPRRNRYALLHALHDRGVVEKHGPAGWTRTYTAVGNAMPPDLRGTGKSLANLKYATKPKGYRKTMDGEIKPIARVSTYRAFLLDKYWGPTPARVDSAGDVCDHTRAEVRPEETEAA